MNTPGGRNGESARGRIFAALPCVGPFSTLLTLSLPGRTKASTGLNRCTASQNFTSRALSPSSMACTMSVRPPTPPRPSGKRISTSTEAVPLSGFLSLEDVDVAGGRGFVGSPRSTPKTSASKKAPLRLSPTIVGAKNKPCFVCFVWFRCGVSTFLWFFFSNTQKKSGARGGGECSRGRFE